MPPIGFEPTISMLERAKTVHVLDCAATVTANTQFEPFGSQAGIRKQMHIVVKCIQMLLPLRIIIW
jgi:hypothetical protein